MIIIWIAIALTFVALAMGREEIAGGLLLGMLFVITYYQIKVWLQL